MDDFNQDDEFYWQLPEGKDIGDFLVLMMHLTSVIKKVNFDDTLRGGHEFMMTVFNMTGLEAEEKNEQVLNVTMGLISHIFALLLFIDDRDKYFNYFDETVIYPMINDNE